MSQPKLISDQRGSELSRMIQQLSDQARRALDVSGPRIAAIVGSLSRTVKPPAESDET